MKKAGALPSPPWTVSSCQQLPRVAVWGLVNPTWLPLPVHSLPRPAPTLSGRLKAGTPRFPPSNRRAQFRWLPGPCTSCSRDLAIQLHPPQPSLALSKFSVQAILPSVCSGQCCREGSTGGWSHLAGRVVCPGLP